MHNNPFKRRMALHALPQDFHAQHAQHAEQADQQQQRPGSRPRLAGSSMLQAAQWELRALGRRLASGEARNVLEAAQLIASLLFILLYVWSTYGGRRTLPPCYHTGTCACT